MNICHSYNSTSNTNNTLYKGQPHLTDMRFCYSGLQSEGPPRHEHDSDTKRGVASAMKPPDKKNTTPGLRELDAAVGHAAGAGAWLGSSWYSC